MKKIISFITVAAIASAYLTAGCEKKENTGDNSVPTLTWYVPNSQQTDTESVVAKANEIIEKEIGAKLDLIFVDASSFSEKLNMYMASGNKFDLCFTGYVNPFATAVQRGGLMELSELLETVPKLKEAVPQYYWDIATVNDGIYAVPNQQILGGSLSVVIKKDLADKYGFDVSSIRKTEDIEPFLQKVAENEKNIYPFKPSSGTGSFASLDHETYDYSLTSGVDLEEDENGFKITSLYEKESFKENAKKLNEWFKKGYIRKDIASVTDDTQDLNSGKYASWITTYKPGVSEELSKSLGFDVYVAPISKPYINARAGRDTMIGIGKHSQHPELAIKLIELVNTNKELYNLLAFGIEGKHYEKIDENHIRYIDNSGYMPNAAWEFGNQFNALLLEDQEDDVWEQTKKINESAFKSHLIGFTPDVTPVRTEVSQIETVIGEYNVIEKGAKDPDTYYDEFISKLKQAGIDKVVEEINKQAQQFEK